MPDRVISVPQAQRIVQATKNQLDNVNGRLGDVNLFTFSRSASIGEYWNNTVTKAIPSGSKLKAVLKSYDGTHLRILRLRGYYDETQYDSLGTINQIGGSINITTEKAYINLRFVFEATETEGAGTASVLLLLDDDSGIANEVMLNATNIATNSQNIATNSQNIQTNASSIDELSVGFGNLKNALNNEIDLSEYDWVIGSLSPGTGTEDNNSNKRIRSSFIPVANGTKFTVMGNPACLIVYLFNETGGYLSDSTWNDGNVFVVENDNACYARVLLRKSSSNEVLTDADIDEQVERCSAYAQLSNGEYLIPRRVSKLETNSGEYIVRSASTSASTGEYWNINNDATPISAGSIVRFTLNNYSGDNLDTYYFKGRKKNGTTITNVTLVSSKETGIEFVVQTTEDYIGYQIQVYRSATENRAVTVDYSFAVYDAEGFPVYLMSKLAETNSGKVYSDEVKATIEASQTVLAASATPMLTFAVFTDLHHDPKYPYDPTVDMFANIKAIYDRIHFDGLINLGDAIDGQNQTQYQAEGCISDVVTAMYDITDRSHNLIGNHDDNVQSTWDNRGGQPATEQLTLLELNNALFKGSKNEVHNASHITDYYIDYDEYGIRVICIGVDYTSYNANTQTWLENTALQTDKKVLVFSHCATKAEWGYLNDVANGTYVETPLNNFVANGGTILAFIHGHTHGDMIETDSSISFTEVAIGCAKFEKMSSGTTGMTYQDRNASDYTKILFDLVCVDQTNRKVHFIRCGAGTDREVSY